MPAKTNKTEGLSLSPRDFLTDRPGAFAPWFALYLCCAEATNNGVGPHDIFGINLTATDQKPTDTVLSRGAVLLIQRNLTPWNGLYGHFWGESGERKRDPQPQE